MSSILDAMKFLYKLNEVDDDEIRNWSLSNDRLDNWLFKIDFEICRFAKYAVDYKNKADGKVSNVFYKNHDELEITIDEKKISWNTIYCIFMNHSSTSHKRKNF